MENPSPWGGLLSVSKSGKETGEKMRRRLISLVLFVVFIFLWPMISSSSARDFPEAAKKRFRTTPAGAPTGSVEQGIVLLVEFPDVKHDATRNFVMERFFDRLNRYVQEMSYGKVSIGGQVTEKWYRMPDSVSQYKISSRNLEVDKSRVKKLIDDALDAADRDVNFSQHSFSVIFMGAKLQDYGMIGLCGYPGMLGWGSDAVLKTKSGQMVKGGVAIFCYQAHLGTLFHDIAHILGGVKGGKRMVPCLYDHDLQAKPGDMRETFVDSIINMGFWDTLSCHFYKRDIPPPGISSWTKMRLNWIDPSRVKVVKRGEKAEILLGPLEEKNSETLVIKIPISETTYYLIENRQPIGFDKNLPGSGVLIMYADDSIPECRHGKAPVKLIDADPKVRHLEGAAFDIGKKDSFHDEKNRIRIRLLKKTGDAYKILIEK
jgi:immune inhibitor A